MVSLFGRGFDSLQLHRKHYFGSAFLLCDTNSNLFYTNTELVSAVLRYLCRMNVHAVANGWFCRRLVWKTFDTS